VCSSFRLFMLPVVAQNLLLIVVGAPTGNIPLARIC
jgi:hypothetical protein